jgi:histidinol-phosphate aminotransferase
MRHLDRRQALALAFGASLLSPLSSRADAAQAAGKIGAPATDAVSRPIQLGFNENPWGPGPKARAAVAAAIDDGCRYGNEYSTRLIAAIAAREGVAPERIVLGSGSGELLHMLAFGWASRSIVTCAWPTFGQLMTFAEKVAAEVRRVPLDERLQHDLAAIAAAAPSGEGLVYLCNPNNPTGTVIDGPRLREACRALAARTLVVVDEAYMDLIEPGATESMVDLARGDTNVIVLRTFSKVHGLAGLRVGYAIGRPDNIKKLRNLQMATPNVLGLAAAAASLTDEAFIKASREHIVADRRRVSAACRELGMECSESHGNFVFVRTGVPVTEFRARMRSLGIEVGRPFEPLVDWCRISLGRTADNTALIAALRQFKGVTA